MGKIYGRVQRLADRGMVGKLLAIIGRNRLGMPLMGREQRNGSPPLASVPPLTPRLLLRRPRVAIRASSGSSVL